MKKILSLILLIFLSGCYIEEDNFLSTPLILAFPNGKSWQVQELVLNDPETFISDTDTVVFSGNVTSIFDDTDRIFFYNPIGSDPNAGRIETYYVWGTWKNERSSNQLEFLILNFPTNGGSYHRYSFLNEKWRILEKYSNKIEMTDDNGKYLTLVVS
jgi:hypothetical protein